jgi:hypothetical protein
LTLSEMAVTVFHHHDGCVHQYTNGKRQPA